MVMHKHFLEMPLERLCAKALFELKTAGERITSADLAASAHDRLRLAGWAASVGGDIDLRQAGSALTPIISLLERETEGEAAGYYNAFRGSIDPEAGDTGDVVLMPILTERGERIQLWCDRLRRVRHMLEVIEARLAAADAVCPRRRPRVL
jgi:predicted ATPase